MRNVVRLVVLVIALILLYLGLSGKMTTVPIEWAIGGLIVLAIAYGLVTISERRR